MYIPFVVYLGVLLGADAQSIPEDNVPRPDVIYNFLNNPLAKKLLSIRYCRYLQGVQTNKGDSRVLVCEV